MLNKNYIRNRNNKKNEQKGKRKIYARKKTTSKKKYKSSHQIFGENKLKFKTFAQNMCSFDKYTH